MKNDFSEKGHKIPMRRPPTEISCDPYFFTESYWEKNFEVGGPPSTIWGFYLKSRNPKFRSSGKKRVFCVADFFEIATKTTVLSFRGAQNFLYKNLLIYRVSDSKMKDNGDKLVEL